MNGWLVGWLSTKHHIRVGPRCYVELSPCSKSLYMGSQDDLFRGLPGKRTRISGTGCKHPPTRMPGCSPNMNGAEWPGGRCAVRRAPIGQKVE